jgi:hypothetical protein
MINGRPPTVTWHVDNLKSSHIDPKVNDEFLSWLKLKYASDECRTTLKFNQEFIQELNQENRKRIHQNTSKLHNN